MSKSYQWYRSQKRRVQKKYTLLLGRYLTPKELRVYFKRKYVRPTDTEHWRSI